MSGFPSCQVCQQNFSLKGPAPFLLPCLHAVCETCVTSAAGGVISCKPCEKPVNLAETRLQKDIVREKEILHQTVQRNPELVLCTHEEDGNQAVCWCQECDEFLCEHCQMVHNSFKITRQHNVHDVEAMEVGNLNTEKYCTFHPKVPADTWDKDCCMPTCGKCRRGDHAGHDVADVEEAAESARNEISELGNEITPTIDQHRTHLAEAERDLTSLDDKISTLDGKISFTFDSFKVQLDQREKELKIALQNHKGNVREQLVIKKKTSETGYQRCQTTSDYINKTLKYSSMHDILELRQLLKEKSKDCKSSAPSQDYESPPLPMFSTEGLNGVKSTLAQFGTIATEDRISINNMKDNGTQTEEDVMQELERLTQELKRVKTSDENHIREKEENEKEYLKEKEKMKQDLGAYQKKIIGLEKEVERFSGWQRLRSLALDESYLLTCTELKFSKTKFNAETVHVNTGGELINKPQTSSEQIEIRKNRGFSKTKFNAVTVHVSTGGEERLKKYKGTISTAPLPQRGSPQYFEVKTRVGIEKTLAEINILLLEIGLAREEEQDQSHNIGGQPKSYCLTVSHCTIHSSICRDVWSHGESITCLPDTLENSPSSSVTLHYGVVCDSDRRRIAFLDVKNENIIWKIEDVDRSFSLWPIFGVYNPEWATVCMSLVVGVDIDMTEKKKELILDCLS